MSTAVLLWIWFFAHLNCAGRTLPAPYPLPAADGAAGHPARQRVRRNSHHRKTRSAAEAAFRFEAGVEHEHVCDARGTGTDDTAPNYSLPPKAVAEWKPSNAELQAYLNLRLMIFGVEKLP
jgi:hypothetical protein